MEDRQASHRQIPAVHQVLAAYRDAGGAFADPAVTALIRDRLSRVRAGDHAVSGARDDIIARIVTDLIALDRPKLRRVINGTGVILHTNLGRAPVSAGTAAAMADAAAASVSLEIDPESGARGNRMGEIRDLLQALTGAEDALVVNNNAAAVLLVLSALTAGREVILSRGEAVEIGGGVRVPDILARSGARMIEVGTTNRTYARDYAAAIGAQTAVVLKIHPSNFQMRGFVHQASITDLSTIVRSHHIPLVEDQGSGLLLDPSPYGMSGDRPVSDSIAAGADIVTMSGDKLIGGPQAGIIIGKHDLIDQCTRHPLARALRADKTTLAGLAATLRHYARGEAIRTVPVWRMIASSVSEIRDRAESIVATLSTAGRPFEIRESLSTVGGGSLPGETLSSFAISPLLPGDGRVDAYARQLRTGTTGVYGRIEHDAFLIDLRTVLPEDDGALIEALTEATPPISQRPGA